ncbi:hypothetical protein C1H46_004098 [Malus baccata]|uniref:GYF domain-containing protein n=1 Tax=Malus baccata TaxID=106549 RepID=A0A540NGX0_MALBA|nr:hypothetical protein C1H46_004098 [Malus baccata]
MSMPNEESCWLYVDGEGQKRGPLTLYELYLWYRYGFLQDSVMIYHVENKCAPFTLLSIANAWETGPETVANSDAKSNETDSSVSFISEISKGVSSQLHHGILNAAGKVVLEYVENELQLSAKNALTKFVGSFVNEEVKKLDNSSKEENLMKFLASSCISKKTHAYKEKAFIRNKDHLEKHEKESKHCDNSGTAELSPVIGKYTYHHKKLWKKSGLSRSVTLGDTGLQNEIVEKSKKLHVTGDMPEKAELKIATMIPKKRRQIGLHVGSASLQAGDMPERTDLKFSTVIPKKQRQSKSLTESYVGTMSLQAGDMPEKAELKVATVNPKKRRQSKPQTELSVGATSLQAIAKGCSSTDKTEAKISSSCKLLKVSNAVKSSKTMGCTHKLSKKIVSAHVGDQNNVEKVVNSNGHDVGRKIEPLTKQSKLKRDLPMDDLKLSRPKKILKVANGAPKKAACRPVAAGHVQFGKSKKLNPCPKSSGCARVSINGWEWHRWSQNASPAERAHVRGITYVNADAEYQFSDINTSQWSNGKGSFYKNK